MKHRIMVSQTQERILYLEVEASTDAEARVLALGAVDEHSADAPDVVGYGSWTLGEVVVVDSEVLR